MQALLEQFESDDSLAAAAAGQWWTFIQSRPDGRPVLVALSGGRIASKFYASIIQRAPSAATWRSQLQIFWADERCVPPEHADSNYRVALEQLVRPLRLSDGQVRRIRGELPPAEGASLAESDLNAAFQSAGSSALDLAILGMGEDGHVASLFPGDDWESSNPAPLFRSVVASKPPPDRVTLTYRALSEAREAWVLASGKGKSDALRRSLETQDTPLGRLRSMRSSLRIFSDIQ